MIKPATSREMGYYFEVDKKARPFADTKGATDVLTMLLREEVIALPIAKALYGVAMRFFVEGNLPVDHRDPKNYTLEGPDQDGWFDMTIPLVGKPLRSRTLPMAMLDLLGAEAQGNVVEAGFRKLAILILGRIPLAESAEKLLWHDMVDRRAKTAEKKAVLEATDREYERRTLEKLRQHELNRRNIETLDPLDLLVARETREQGGEAPGPLRGYASRPGGMLAALRGYAPIPSGMLAVNADEFFTIARLFGGRPRQDKS